MTIFSVDKGGVPFAIGAGFIDRNAVPNFLKLYPALLGPQDQVDAKIQSVCENHDASFWDVVKSEFHGGHKLGN